MKPETRYRYEQTIRTLRIDLYKAREERQIYKAIVSDVYSEILDYKERNEVVSQMWIIRQMRRVWK